MIKIDFIKKLKFDLHLPNSKSYDNIRFSDQTILHVLNLNTKIFIPVFDIPSNFNNNMITFILFNLP